MVFEDRHRKHKREVEIKETIRVLQRDFPKFKAGEFKILEFGAGACDQVLALQKLGSVTAIDIYTHERIREQNINFFECSITDTPFLDNEFDIIYANHVIAHIGEAQSHGLDEAFNEMKRIGKPGCLYIFSVPTPLWLWLSIPAHYYSMLRSIFKMFRSTSKKYSTKSKLKIESKKKQIAKKRWCELMVPQGLGTYRSFLQANKGFMLQSWIKVFEKYGLRMEAQYPLAVYAASEFPIIPTTTRLNRFNIASSRLLVLKGIQ